MTKAAADEQEEEKISRDISQLSLSSTSSQEQSYKCYNHAENSLIKMQAYLNNGQLCDITLVAGNDGTKVSAHRLVLSACSEYFSVMFTGNLKEANQNEIQLCSVDGDALQNLVQYCYTGSIELREDNVETLLATACLLQLNDVIEACCTFLAKQLHPSNCLGIALFAEQQSCPTLLKKSISYVHENFMQVWRDEEFLRLSDTQLSALLRSDDLNVNSEQEVFLALMEWVNEDKANREKHLPRLLEFIHLSLLSPTFLVDQVDVLCGNILECQRLVVNALKWHLLPERRPYLANNWSRAKKATLGKVIVLGGVDATREATPMELYCPWSDKWSSFGLMSGRKLQFGSVIIKDKLMVVGGRDGLKTLNTVECLDLVSKTWSMLPPMSTHRHGLGVAILEGPLYAIGGHDGWSYLNTVERWDPIARTWSYVAHMICQRNSPGVAVLNGKLYAVGGRDGGGCLSTVECYDPHTNKWKMCASMSIRRGGVAVGAVNGFLYALGGHDAPASNPSASRYDLVERYDPVSNIWTPMASLTCCRDAIGVCVLGDRLLAVGGFDGSKYLTAAEEYNPQTNEWKQVCDMLVGRAGGSVVVMSNSSFPNTMIPEIIKKTSPPSTTANAK